MKKNIMARAWEIARNAYRKFGGKVKEYFSQSLKLAWIEARTIIAIELPNLQGTEKQVKWAEDIRGILLKLTDEITVDFKEKYKNSKGNRGKTLAELLAEGKERSKIFDRYPVALLEIFKEEIQVKESAKYFIENFKILTSRCDEERKREVIIDLATWNYTK